MDGDGNARMVDVGSKPGTLRSATAEGSVILGRVAYTTLSGTMSKKGDIFSVAQIAGILGAKQTPNLIPLCHSVALSSVKLDLKLNSDNYGVDIQATANTCGDARTGVEMEALTAVSIAALTIYDMCKAADKGIEIRRVRLVHKTGGISGDYKLQDKEDNKERK